MEPLRGSYCTAAIVTLAHPVAPSLPYLVMEITMLSGYIPAVLSFVNLLDWVTARFLASLIVVLQSLVGQLPHFT
jgi:hypothetical protein